MKNKFNSRHNILTASEEHSLICKFQETKSDKVFETILSHNIRLIQLAMNDVKTHPIYLPSMNDDLFQAGSVGIYEALQKFDTSKGCRFFTFAMFHLKGSMHCELYRSTSIPSNIVKALGCLPKYYENKYPDKLFSDLTFAEYSTFIKSPDTELSTTKFRFVKLSFDIMMSLYHHGYSFFEVSGYQTEEDDDKNTVSMFDNIPSNEYNEANEVNRDILISQAISSILIMGDEKLGERNMYILRRLFLDSATLETVSDELGVSAERVRQLRNNIINKISTNIEEYNICDSLMEML